MFVTGNANKLREVKAILDAGGAGIEVTNQAVDGKFQRAQWNGHVAEIGFTVPEVQGSTQEVAIAKCQAAAKAVSMPPRANAMAAC